MIYKVLYQPNPQENPKREATKALYLDAPTQAEVRDLIAENTDYVVEFIQPLAGKKLEFEQQEPDFKITEFNK
ncbi:DNA-directed RNA polymerase subunit epsilon [Fructilactobacillus cliffordii]|uniref:DNA-directed RNA polymerase subunit epsilon n=1 Tax=Fructilactobacillus cliffordii TaxID=2940299 RepID=A0A9Q9E280_9LACO|nr:DNA-directed RNA polymerase subunit epsilon [Fructilactobacillus cliffordii]USS89480.1 DNA-directed RNA polymerase subunit epsilon [Fructilactobacillus cliffordii]